MSHLGWQKLDVTVPVRQWYATGGKSRLRFLVDCSGCVDRFKIHLFDSKPAKDSRPRAKPNLLQNGKKTRQTANKLLIFTQLIPSGLFFSFFLNRKIEWYQRPGASIFGHLYRSSCDKTCTTSHARLFGGRSWSML